MWWGGLGRWASRGTSVGWAPPVPRRAVLMERRRSPAVPDESTTAFAAPLRRQRLSHGGLCALLRPRDLLPAGPRQRTRGARALPHGAARRRGRTVRRHRGRRDTSSRGARRSRRVPRDRRHARGHEARERVPRGQPPDGAPDPPGGRRPHRRSADRHIFGRCRQGPRARPPRRRLWAHGRDARLGGGGGGGRLSLFDHRPPDRRGVAAPLHGPAGRAARAVGAPSRHLARGPRGGGTRRPRAVELRSGHRDGRHPARHSRDEALPLVSADPRIPRPLRIGIGGPVGSGKTALVESLCLRMRDRYDLAVITNDIYTQEDAQFLIRRGALPSERVMGVETGGCPHTAIREDASVNLEAAHQLLGRFPGLEMLFVESGGDNLAATFSPELVDATIYVIDVAEGDKIPRKGGPGITRSDLLVINKIDLAPYVGADLSVMERDSKRMRGDRPFVFTNLRDGTGADRVVDWIRRELLFEP